MESLAYEASLLREPGDQGWVGPGMCVWGGLKREAQQDGKAGVFLPRFPHNEEGYFAEWASLLTAGSVFHRVWDAFGAGTQACSRFHCRMEEETSGDWWRDQWAAPGSCSGEMA